ncbi:LemA family protein [Sphingomonas parva]|uniref:LemA family protein n=1 Tax=Sphingomonas parva TaxID=2555898 RepID=A0A4Y8ZTR1_9SPHN|nr:LemA family protein [Sphingomonas parva]TFI59400.1 LemA family protein [Sphingomonas parva]
MKKSLMSAFLLPVAGVSLAGCGVNSVPTAEEEAKARWADVQAAYQRRASLIPNLVATTKGAAASEQQILTNVTEARAKAGSIQITTDDLSDPAKLRQFSESQNQLTQALGQLRTVVEAYPDLKSQQNFQSLMQQLEGTENRINIAIRDYNSAVQAYNTRIRTFPDVIGAKVFYGAEPMATFQATTPNADQAPTVDFGNSGG